MFGTSALRYTRISLTKIPLVLLAVKRIDLSPTRSSKPLSKGSAHLISHRLRRSRIIFPRLGGRLPAGESRLDRWLGRTHEQYYRYPRNPLGIVMAKLDAAGRQRGGRHGR